MSHTFDWCYSGIYPALPLATEALTAAVRKFPCVRACVRRRLCIFGGIPEKCELPRWTEVAIALYEQRLAATYVLPWPIIPARFTGRVYMTDIARCLALAGHEVATNDDMGELSADNYLRERFAHASEIQAFVYVDRKRVQLPLEHLHLTNNR